MGLISNFFMPGPSYLTERDRERQREREKERKETDKVGVKELISKRSFTDSHNVFPSIARENKIGVVVQSHSHKQAQLVLCTIPHCSEELPATQRQQG